MIATFPIILLLLVFVITALFLFEDMQARNGSNRFSVITSSFHCTETENFEDRRCLFRDVYFVGNSLWVVANASVKIPPLLCTSVNTPAAEARNCSIEVHTRKELDRRLSFPGVRLHTYDTGVLFSRLCPSNAYHSLFEEYIPIYEMIANTPELAHWLEPSTSGMSQLLLMQDRFHDVTISNQHGRTLFPSAQTIERYKFFSVFHVKFLVAGTQGSCVHAHHCTKGRFLTPDIGAQFRQFALQRFDLQEVQPHRSPRVTIVQRSKSRIIANLDGMVAKVNELLAAHGPLSLEAKVVDFSQLPMRDQVEATVNTDLLVMVHGGAYGNVIFLPRHAVVVDIFPYGFLPALHGYVMNGIQLAAPSMKYGYRRVETNDSSTVVMTDGYCLPPNCAAMDTISPFRLTKCLYVDLEAFAVHFAEVLRAWCHAVWGSNPRSEASCVGSAAAAQGVYAPPPSTAEFNARTREVRAQFKGDPKSCDRHVKCDAATQKRFRAHPQCKVR